MGVAQQPQLLKAFQPHYACSYCHQKDDNNAFFPRNLKNVKTGTDINVPSYQKASSPRNVKDYHVVVISKLPYFKQPEHSEEDIVQFMVPRDYAAFEKLQKELLEQFPSLKLPDLPRKLVLFMSDEDLEDRRVSFDCLMIIVSRSVELTTSIPMLEFLGIDLLADRKYKKRRAEYLESKGNTSATQKGEDGGEEEEEEEPQDLFSDKKKVTSKGGGDGDVEDKSIFEDDDILFSDIGNGGKTNSSTDRDLFDDEATTTTTRRTAKMTLLDDEPELNMSILKTKEHETEDSLFTEIEDHSDLLNVSDTLDDVLKVAHEKPKKKPKPKPAKKPLATSLFEEDSKAGGGGGGGGGGVVDKMGTDDISKYIQLNQQGNDNDDDLELF